MPRRRGHDATRGTKRRSTGRQYEAAPDDVAQSRRRPKQHQKLRQNKRGLTATVEPTPAVKRRHAYVKRFR